MALGSKKLEIGGKAYPMIGIAAFLIAGGVLCFMAPAYINYVIAAMLAAYVIIAIAYVIKMM